MITLSSIGELTSAQEAFRDLHKTHPNLFEKFLDVIYLTRALQFKYQYMGCLLMDEDPGENTPGFVHSSVLRLYKREIQQLKNDENIRALRAILKEHKSNGYAKLCLLVLGQNPESLVGPTFVQ